MPPPATAMESITRMLVENVRVCVCVSSSMALKLLELLFVPLSDLSLDFYRGLLGYWRSSLDYLIVSFLLMAFTTFFSFSSAN